MTLGSEEKQVEALKHLLLLLKQGHLDLLRGLLLLIEKVQNEPANKMDSKNLSVVLGPNLFEIATQDLLTQQHNVNAVCE